MTPRRRLLQAAGLVAGAGLTGLPLHAQQAPAAAPGAPKVLRFAIRIAETGFDPAQVSDLYSRMIVAAIFDAPVDIEYLARPVRVRANTLVALPEVNDDYTRFTLKVRPGIYFAEDAAFKGQRRELVAQDYVYALKRHYDPKNKSNNLFILENAKISGVSELRRELMEAKKPFDYDREVSGLRAIDRYTFEIRLDEPNPRFVDDLANQAFGAVAREVVEFYGDKIMEHPVGTGPFKLGAWRRASRIVLERNPGYREEYFDEEAPADDPIAQAVVKANKGKKLPLLDRVEVSIIEENQPRWLAFLNGEHDLLEEVPADFANLIIPNNQLAPNLKKRGIQMVRYARADIAMSYFNMEDPVVGGYTPEKVALRRAISLAVDVEKEIRLVRRGQAVVAQSIIAPGTWGYVPGFKSEMGNFDRARARGLLDLYGYVDRDGDGWRELPDGKPLTLEYATQPDGQSRQLIEQWQKNMAAIGIRIEFKTAKWPENLKASNAGKLQMWGVGWTGGNDADGFLVVAYGPAKGQANKARFALPAFDKLFDQQKRMPNGPERQAVIDEAKKLLIAYMPIKIHVHRIFTDLTQPWVAGYHRNVFLSLGRALRFVDVDPAAQAKAQA